MQALALGAFAMTHPSDIERIVEEAIHSVIVVFDPNYSISYRDCAEVLRLLAEKISLAPCAPALRNKLMVRTKAQLASLAYEVGDNAAAERTTAEILALASPEEPDFLAMVMIRVKALHALGRHEEEIADVLRYACREKMDGHGLVHLLAYVVKRHPGKVELDEALLTRVRAFVRDSSELARRLSLQGLDEGDPGEYVLAVAQAAREINLEMTAEILGES